jgi:D-aminopeptidase
LDARELPYFSSAQLSQDRDSAVAVDSPCAMTSLFRAAAEATEEAILNALCMAETMIGKDGRTIHALPLDRVQQVMQRYGPR